MALFHSVSINSNRHSVMGNRKVSSPLTGNGEAAILCYVGMYVCIGGEGRRRGGGQNESFFQLWCKFMCSLSHPVDGEGDGGVKI